MTLVRVFRLFPRPAFSSIIQLPMSARSKMGAVCFAWFALLWFLFSFGRNHASWNAVHVQCQSGARRRHSRVYILGWWKINVAVNTSGNWVLFSQASGRVWLFNWWNWKSADNDILDCCTPTKQSPEVNTAQDWCGTWQQVLQYTSLVSKISEKCTACVYN